jgi:histidinol-phosphate aminotransferase
VTRSILELARPDIVALQPYQHAAWDPSFERMHANEMPWRAQGDNTMAGLNRYPEPQPRALVERMALLYGAPAGQVLVGRGSDEAIDLLVRAFCRAGADAVVITPPTFGFYKVAAKIQGAVVHEAPLADGYQLDVEAVIAAGRKSKLVFLCSPNNPTGNLFREADMLRVCKDLAGTALVVVDEAYIEFSGRESLIGRLGEYPNLVLLRTLSKAYALAGARLGTLIASEDIVNLLKRIIPPYAIPASTVEEVVALTEAPQRALAVARIKTLLAERVNMHTRLERCQRTVVRVHPSDANFLLVECRDPRLVLDASKAVGLIVRDFSATPALAGHLRISVGTPSQNERLLAAVESA